jgi:hypothetical protein
MMSPSSNKSDVKMPRVIYDVLPYILMGVATAYLFANEPDTMVVGGLETAALLHALIVFSFSEFVYLSCWTTVLTLTLSETLRPVADSTNSFGWLYTLWDRATSSWATRIPILIAVSGLLYRHHRNKQEMQQTKEDFLEAASIKSQFVATMSYAIV